MDSRWRTLLAMLLLTSAATAAEQVSVTPAAGDLAAPGFSTPFRVQVTNPSSEPVTSVTLNVNQLLRYELATTIPPGQSRTLTAAPWYFDGEVTVSNTSAEASVILTPRRLPDNIVLLLVDVEGLTAEYVTRQMAAMARHYFPKQAEAEAIKRLWPRPARIDAETVLLCRDSAAGGVVIKADHVRLSSLREAARRAGLDLWTIDSDGAVQLVESVPRSLWPLAGRRPGSPASPHVQPTLFDPSKATPPSSIPEEPFLAKAEWVPADGLRLLLPVGVAIVLLLCLAMLGPGWPRWAKIVTVLAVSLVAVVWILVVVPQADRVFVDTVTITVCDATSGRAITQYVAAATGLTRETLAITFDEPGGALPRPLVANAEDRSLYEGVHLARDLEQRWSARAVPVIAGQVSAFSSTRWSLGDFPIQMQSGPTRVRLDLRKPLADAYLYRGPLARRMTDLGGGLYGADATARPIDNLILHGGDLSPADAFRKRTMRWVKRRLLRGNQDVLFGWADEATPIGAPGARVTNHGHLIVWLIPHAG